MKISYKNAIITIGGASAVVVTDKAYANKQKAVITKSSGFVSALTALNNLLDKIADNNEITKDIYRIYVPDMLKGFSMGTFIEYVRTNQTSSGREFTEEEKQLVHEVANKMANKMFNFRINESKFAPKELTNMKNYAIALAKEAKEIAPAKQPAPAPQVAPQTNPAIAKLQELMVKALDEGDFDAYDKLEARLNRLTQSQGTQVAPQAPAVESQQPQEENEELEDNEVELDEELVNMEY
mgnify:CR=1 FL=1